MDNGHGMSISNLNNRQKHGVLGMNGSVSDSGCSLLNNDTTEKHICIVSHGYS